MKKIILSFLIAILVLGGYAQNVNMPNDSSSITTCNATFFDKGGATGNHGANQNSLLLFTPGTPGMAVRLIFSIFTVGEGAVMTIYDGPSTSDVIIATYDEFINPVGLDIVASANNPTGQILVSFVSGSSNEIGWRAAVDCRAPCQNYDISVNELLSSHPIVDTFYMNVCKGGCIDFVAQTNYYQNSTLYTQSDSTTTFIWKFGNTVLDTGYAITQCFNEVRGYDYTLYAIDVQGCYPNTIYKGRIRVADNPIKLIPPLPELCTGDEFLVDVGTSSSSIVQIGAIGAAVSGTLSHADTTFLPDGSNISYNSDLTYDIFEPGQLLTNVNQLLAIFLSLEHSYLGDLDIKIRCPNNTTCQLKAYGTMPVSQIATAGSTGGGSINLGYAPDPSSGSPCYLTPGVGYMYYFTPTATNAMGNGGPTTSMNWPAVQPTYPCINVFSYAVTVLDSGYYGAYENMQALVGCPLNGTWRIIVTDHLGLDNGYIFKWGLSLDESLIPGDWEYDVGLDTVLWSGHGITPVSDSLARIVATIAGPQQYDFTIIDEYGCEYDSFFTINFTQSPQPDLGEDYGICHGSIDTLYSNYDEPNTNYYWNNGANTQDIMVVSEGQYSVYIETTNDAGTLTCSGSDTITISTLPQPIVDFEANVTQSCAPMTLIFDNLTTPDDSVEINFDWRLYDQESHLVYSSYLKDPSFLIEVPDIYHVQLVASTGDGCVDSMTKWNYITVDAQPIAEFSADPENSLLGDGGIVNFTNYADTTILQDPQTNWHWDFADGTLDSSAFSPAHTYSTWGDYEVTLFIETQAGCKSEITHTVVIEADLQFPNVITPNNDGKNDVFYVINLNTNINFEDPDDYRTNSLHIFDRWGKKVYEAENYDTYLKDGDPFIGEKYFDGSNLSDGVYYFTFYYKGKVKTVNYHGTINIIR